MQSEGSTKRCLTNCNTRNNMNFQSVLRFLSILSLNGVLLYEFLFIQRMASFRWYDWLAIVLCIMGAIISIGYEVSMDDDDKYDWDEIGDSGYVVARLSNLLTCGLLVWKSVMLQQALPLSLPFFGACVITIGLFSVFNFYYWLVSLVSAFGIFYVIYHLQLSGWLFYIAIVGIVLVTLFIMLIIASAVDHYWVEIGKRIRAEEENKVLLQLQLEEERRKNKWWKFWY